RTPPTEIYTLSLHDALPISFEQAIAKLSRKEFFELVRHLRERHAREWDLQIEEDAQSGKLREVYQRLEAENEDQPEMPLDDFLRSEEHTSELQSRFDLVCRL